MTDDDAALPLPEDADAVLARWQAEHDAARARMRARGNAIAAATGAGLAGPGGLTGQALMEALLRGELPYPPICDTLDFVLVEVGLGQAAFLGRPREAHYNPMGTVHGGWFATLLDSAVGCAVQSALPAGKAYTTAELKINVVRPLTDRMPLVRAEGRTLHVGSRMATADGRLTGADGRLYAHASTTCFVFDAP